MAQRDPTTKSLASELSPQQVSTSIPSQSLSSVPIVDMIRPTKLQPLGDVNVEDVGSETSPTSDSYSYTVPGSSGTMKETHIFTPITPKSVTKMIGTSIADSATSVPIATIITTNAIDQFLPSLASSNGISQCACDNDAFQSDTIIIKENVVKKEYRDVEYEPNKLVANASADDFTEFQFVQPIQSMPNSNSIIEQNVSNAPLNNQSNSISLLPDIYEKLAQKPMPNDRNTNNYDSLASISATTLETISATAAAGNRSELDLYSINKSSFTPSPYSNVATANTAPLEQFACTTDPMGIFSIQSAQYNSHPSLKQQQSTIDIASLSINPGTQQPNTNNINNNNIDSISIGHNNNNDNNSMENSMNLVRSTNSTTYIGGGSNILVPQAANNVQLKQANADTNALTIQWPEPGINIDQLEQLEARFSIQPDSNIKCEKSTATRANEFASSSSSSSSSMTATATAATTTTAMTTTTTTTADDEWSDFVSVVQPQTPITNILNKNLLKQQNNDEDDWSEFVSSTPPPPNKLQQFAPSSQPQHLLGINANANTNTNYNNVFQPWTTTPFSQKITAYQQNIPDSYTKSANSLRYTKTVNSLTNGESSHTFQNSMPKPAATPSIISLPELGYRMAPKSLINMPNRTLAKK